MTWNYRVCKHTRKYDKKCYPKKYWGKSFTWYEIHEVYYRKNGNPYLVTQEPITFGGDSPKEVQICLAMALADALKHPALDFKSIGKKKGKKKK